MTEFKSIWHKLPEQPESGRDVLEKWHHLGIHYTHFVSKNGIAEDNPFTDSWCYLDDLLACEKELADTKKKLDIAVDGITYMRNNCLDYAADYMDYADGILEQIKDKEQQ